MRKFSPPKQQKCVFSNFMFFTKSSKIKSWTQATKWVEMKDLDVSVGGSEQSNTKLLPKCLKVFGHEIGRDERFRRIRRWKFHVKSVRNFYCFMLGGEFRLKNQ